MERLLRLSGMLDDDGETDLGTLEKMLAEKKESLSRRTSTVPTSGPVSPTQSSNKEEDNESTPRSSFASPEPPSVKNVELKSKNGDKRKSATPEKSEEEVAALSDMMCSLVTNNCGETRYIGMIFFSEYLAFAD